MVSLLPVSQYSFTLSPPMCTQTYLDLFFLGLADCTCLISTCLMNWVSTELPCTPGQDLSLSCSTSVTLCITPCLPSLEVPVPGLSLSSTLLVVVCAWCWCWCWPCRVGTWQSGPLCCRYCTSSLLLDTFLLHVHRCISCTCLLLLPPVMMWLCHCISHSS